MADLMNVFGPIAKWNETLRDIQTVGIDVMGTTIDHQGRIHKEVTDLVVHLNKVYLDLTITFISTEPTRAWMALLEAGMKGKCVDHGVELKDDFYARAKRGGLKILSIDDETTQAARADVHIDPKDSEVKTYLEKRDYRRSLKIQEPDASP